MTWLKRQLREAQDTIVQLREAQRLSEERYAKHSRECEAAEEIARAALASEQKKQD
jgi:phage shock protein A